VSNVVNHVVVSIINSEECNSMYENIAIKVKLVISDDMLCAGWTAGGRDACQVENNNYSNIIQKLQDLY